MKSMTPNVLTLEEVSEYLRLPPEAVERQVARGQLPGRRIEDTWRFLKTAIDDWLRGQDDRLILLQQAGALQDDDAWPELLEDVYARRGRPMVEPDDD